MVPDRLIDLYNRWSSKPGSDIEESPELIEAGLLYGITQGRPVTPSAQGYTIIAKVLVQHQVYMGPPNNCR